MGLPYSAKKEGDPSGALAPRIVGIVKDSHPAESDNPLTHEHMFERPEIVDHVRWPEWSDWNVIIHPLHPYRNLLGAAQRTFEIEFELYFARHYFVQESAEPKPGDLLFTAGRWIVDCGHDTFLTEIHPPFVLATMRTVDYKGNPATEAKMWVNGWFPGDPVEFAIYPPPDLGPTRH